MRKWTCHVSWGIVESLQWISRWNFCWRCSIAFTLQKTTRYRVKQWLLAHTSLQRCGDRVLHTKTRSFRSQQGRWNLGSFHWGSIATYERQKESRRHRHKKVTVSQLLESERLRHTTSQKLARVEQCGRQGRRRAFPQANWECHWLVKLNRYKRTNYLFVYCLKFKVEKMKLCQLGLWKLEQLGSQMDQRESFAEFFHELDHNIW